MKTRGSLGGVVPVLGIPAVDLDGSKLPTTGEVLACFIYTREKLKFDAASSKYPTRLAVLQAVAARVTAVWQSAGLPVISAPKIREKVDRKVSEMEYLRDYPVKKRGEAYQVRQEKILEDSANLLDICRCKCDSEESCNCHDIKPELENRRPFLEDQRGRRALTIQGLTCRAGASPAPQEYHPTAGSSPASSSELQPSQQQGPSHSVASSPARSSRTSSWASSPSPEKRRRLAQDQRDTDFAPSRPAVLQPRPVTRNMIPLPHTASTAVRYNVSSTAAAAICSAFAVDSGLVTTEDKSLVVDPSKMRRQKTMVMEKANVTGLESCSHPIGIYFDGRKDDTLVGEDLPGTLVPNTRHVNKKENHIVLVAEPGSRYIGHVTASGSLAVDEARAIVSGLHQRGVATGGVRVAGCDGTPYNTGPKDAVVASLEKELQRPLQRVVCMLHFNELPLKRLMKTFDGPTSGPDKWTGPIGSRLKEAETLPIKKFKCIDGRLPDVDRSSMNWEQKYLYDLVLAIITGVVPVGLAARNPGELHQARWVTLASRLLRVYVAEVRPSATLRHLAVYVVKVYVPCMFAIKRQPLAEQGPHHLLQHIQASRCLPKKWQEVIHDSIQINAFFAHPENLLLSISMMADERQAFRDLALQRILEARMEVGTKIRTFSVPPINFRAEEYVDLICWETVRVTPPPLLDDYSDDELKAAAAARPLPLPPLLTPTCYQGEYFTFVWNFICCTCVSFRSLMLVRVCSFRAFLHAS